MTFSKVIEFNYRGIRCEIDEEDGFSTNKCYMVWCGSKHNKGKFQSIQDAFCSLIDAIDRLMLTLDFCEEDKPKNKQLDDFA